MRIVLFSHSLLSDWNHGNAHFLRGLVTELVDRGHTVRVFEPARGWSVENLLASAGPEALEETRAYYPALDVVRYESGLDVEAATDGADLVIVHEWTEPEIVAAVGRARLSPSSRFKLLFHDTHHRSVTDPEALGAYDLSGYDGVLAFGAAVRERYLRLGWADRVWVFHEAADVRVFRPWPDSALRAGLCFVGNWGDDERTAELQEFLFEPAAAAGCGGSVYGVRYPEEGRAAVAKAGLRYRGWVPNYRVPEIFGQHRVTVHVPRRPYARALPGIPTIRVFEALACGIPLVSAPWIDSEGLFGADDFLRVRNGDEALQALRLVLDDPMAAAEFARRGRATVLARHTCAHRADALLDIAREIGVVDTRSRVTRPSVRNEVKVWD